MFNPSCCVLGQIHTTFLSDIYNWDNISFLEHSGRTCYGFFFFFFMSPLLYHINVRFLPSCPASLTAGLWRPPSVEWNDVCKDVSQDTPAKVKCALQLGSLLLFLDLPGRRRTRVRKPPDDCLLRALPGVSCATSMRPPERSTTRPFRRSCDALVRCFMHVFTAQPSLFSSLRSPWLRPSRLSQHGTACNNSRLSCCSCSRPQPDSTKLLGSSTPYWPLVVSITSFSCFDRSSGAAFSAH